MIITHKIPMDLTRRSMMLPPVLVMQGDECSRELELLLTANGDPWEIPEDFAALIVWHRESDKVGGSYDALPGGELAYSKKENVLTVRLIPQVCASPGKVYLSVMLASANAVAHTFTISIDVQKNPGLQESVPAPAPDVYQQILGEYSMMSARVNNLASLKEGSTTGDAELIDGRADHTGQVHPNIGSHIRKVGGIANDLYGTKTVAVTRSGSVAGEAVSMYATRLEVVGAARYLERVRVPVQVTETDAEIVVKITAGEDPFSPIATKLAKAPAPGQLQVELDVGRWFAPGERIVIWVAENEGGPYLLYPTSGENLSVDWLRDTPGCGGWIDEETQMWAFDSAEVRFTGELIFYDTLREEMLQLEENAVSCTPQTLTEAQKAQARENIGINNDPDIHAEYFTITDDGVVSLKPEYRGKCPSARASAFPLAISDNGINNYGSKHMELPKYLVIPEVVNETAVVSLAPGMFMRNPGVEEIVLPYFITAIPDRFCDSCFYLRKLHGTENIVTVGQVCFQQSRIEKAVFPKLTSLGMGAFYRCPFLIYADLGSITRIEDLTFTYASMLSRIKGGASITFVGQQAFTKNYRLYNVEFLPNLKSIGFEAFHRCRLKYDWKSLADKGCTFPDEQKANGDSLPYNGKNTPWHFQGKPTSRWWENCTVTPCANPVPTLLSQTDPRWVYREINNGRTYETGCTWMTIMHIYCALHNLTLSTVEEFENICNSINPEIIKMFVDGTLETAARILQALGLETSLAPASQERLQTMYNALNTGAYAVTELYKDSISNMLHAAMIYGVNANKELLIADSNVPADENVNAGEHTIKYAMPIENAALLTGNTPCRILIASLPTA